MNNKNLLFLAIILILNLIWEFSHYSLYYDYNLIKGPIHLIGASFVDVFLILFFILIISRINKNQKWFENPTKKDYILFIIISLVFAFIWELINLKFGRWTYKDTMPLIFGIGLSPLIQLATTGTLGLIIYHKLSNSCN